MIGASLGSIILPDMPTQRRLPLPLLAASVAFLHLGMPAAAQYGSAADPYIFIGFNPEPVNASDRMETIDAANAWGDYLREAGVGEFQVFIFETLAETDRFIKERHAMGKPPVFAAMHNLVALSRAKEWKATPILCPVLDGRTTIERLVVVLRSHPAKSLADLDGQRLAVVKMWAEVPDLLGLTLYSEAVSPASKFKELVPVESQRDCLVSVIRRGADAAMVNKGFFEAAREKNRQVWAEFKVIAELPAQHLATIMTFDQAPAEVSEALKTASLNARDSDSGQHFLDVFNIDGFEVCTNETYANVEGKLLSKLKPRGAPGATGATPAAGTPPAAAADPGGAMEELAEAKLVELSLEKDEGGEVLISAQLSAPLPAPPAARVALDDGPEQELQMQCAESLCVATLSPDAIGKASKLSVLLVVSKDGKSLRLGSKKSYNLPK